MHRRLAWALSVAVSAVFLASLLAAGPAVARTVILDGFPPLTQVEGGEPEPDLVAPEVYPGPDEIPGVMAAGGPPPAPEGGAGSMSGVPAYVWRHGCGPTSAGMVLGYWDGHGFPDLVPGDAGSQTASVDAMVASTEHYNDYGVPRDDSGAILADKSQLGGAHASNCVADFIHTSWSSDSLRYGWSMVTTSTSATYGISYGMEAYALLANAAYGSSSLSQRVDTNITAGWTAFVAEIDAGRPTVFLVDTEGDALTDHMVAVFGYEQTGGKNYYICYNTWDTAVHKYEYRARASGVTWGVAYASYFLPTLYSISGTVTSGGSGLGGVLVDAGGHSATTASDGTYTISGLPPTTYTVTPSKTDFVFSPASLSVTVGPNASGKDFAATSTLTYSISGQVTSSGSPLSGVIVDAGGGHSATTAADGTYAIAGLTPATYTVTPSKSEYTFSPASLSVTVGPNATGKDFAATQNTYTVTGTITSGGSGLPGVTVAAGSATTTTAADGTYTIAGLAAAAYTVTPSKTEYVFSPASLSVTVGPSASGKDFAATQETYTISGAVTSGGSGLSGVVVSAGGASATTGSNGIYTITGLIAGDYSVTPSKAEYTFTPPSLSVSLGPNASGNDFAATQNTYGISGTIATDGGTPVGGVYVDAGGGHTDTTASDGTYAIGDLVAGTYTVTPSASGYTFGPVSLSVTVGPDATGQGFEATQDPGTFSVSGTVTVGGAGLPQVLVDAGGGFTTSTGANGAYTISGLPAGLYTLTPSKAEYSFSPVSISVNVGGQGDLTGKDFAATQNTYAISGTIAVGGVGLASVTVAAGGQSATTDADGKFSITGLVAGTYTVTPARAEHSFSPASTSVTVGPSATGKDFTATQNTYAVSGTVTFGGSGLSGVQVTAGGSSATTGADGKYSIAGLTAGSYTVTAAKAPYTFSPGSRGVTVGPSAAGADFTADRTYAVSGSVTLGGSGLPGVTVSAGGQTATTAADGTYTISGLTAGTYTVTPSRSEYAFSPTTQPATVGPDAAGLDFAAAQVTYSIAGSAKVGDVGLAGVSISAGGSTTTTAADGTFTISGLAAGSYTVTPSLGEYTFSPSSLSVTLGPNATGQAFTATQKTYTISGTVAAGGVGVSGVTVATGGKSVTTTDSGAYSITGLVAGTYTVTASKAGYVTTPASLAVTVGPDATGRSFAAAPTYGISGSITAGGRGLGGVTVSVGGQSCITAADGTYSLSGLVAGGYTITPSKAEYGFLPASLPVTVGPSTTGRDFTATQNTYTIAGTISSGGSGLPGVAVSAGGQSAVTGSNGSYTISGLVAGEYVVTPSKAEYTFSPASMSAALGPNATGVNCTATRRTYTISGRVTGSSGVGLAGVTVQAGGATVTTATGGTYAFSGLVSGDYTVTPSKNGYAFGLRSRSVTIGPDATNQDFAGEVVYSHTSPSGWSMLSVPLSAVTGSIGGILGDPALNAATWDPTTGQYVLLSGPPVLGGAYWIRPPRSVDLAVVGTPVQGGNHTAALKAGWQMVGNPFLDAIDWPSISVRSGGSTVSLSQAAANGWVASYGWVYDPANSSYQLVHDAVPGARRQIAPWEGFFIYASQPVELLLPRASGAAAASVVPMSRSAGNGFTVGLSVRCLDVADTCNTLGVSGPQGPLAQGMSAEEPPQLPGTVNLSFISPEGGRLCAVDIRSTTDGQQQEWEWDALVRTDIRNAPVTITFTDLRDLPRDLEAVLTDVGAGRSVYLRTTPSYTFGSDDGGADRRFHIVIRRRGVGLRIMAVTSHSLRSGNVSLAYTLSAPAQVTARVLNAAGRLVAVPANGEVQAAGARSLIWSGRNTEGSRVPPGTYIVELRAATETGEQTQAALQVRVAP